MNTDRKHWAVVALTASLSCGAYAQDRIKVGFMLPYSGTYAALGSDRKSVV